ncbi:MAG: DNA-directed RNA polymerase subunit beta' [Dehalococcoidia bacterium]|tara:strand:+ start:2334 stop:6509 length:4176 start_codon:yes stop_codon:yes gene_type:complete
MTTRSSSDFNSIRISLASPEQIRAWSYGEVTKPETINYRTLRPEKDGLFCEKIFGPTKDWECYCGKYKKIRYKGVICDRCGVEVTRAKVRRERMGHIKLAAPVAHIWFSKSTPSRLGLLLDVSPKNLERVLYFAQYIVTSINNDEKLDAINFFRQDTEQKIDDLNKKRDEILASEEIAQELERLEVKVKKSELKDPEKLKDILKSKYEDLIEEEQDLTETKIEELEALDVMQLLTEAKYREYRDKYGPVFIAEMGAEAILKILKEFDLEKATDQLIDEIRQTSGQRRKKAIKRLRVIESFKQSGNKPEWMVLTVLPVLPPELHPMVQLDGGRFATSDLNDLYRRVINRNNRLKHLLDLQAPEIIIRNEKRMLQEAVDALIDNGRRGRPILGSHNHKLKSLTDLLRGKQGRFRQNLLGKRVDYSGRSVIISGPQLKLYECGLPKKMALELFKPFVMNSLVVKGYAHNIKSAKRLAEKSQPEIWDILEEVIKDHPVLLNRAPTLHRLGIQAFQPVLVEGSAIQLHPLVCTAFNADFDGDQMAVHVPLSKESVLEAKKIMLSTNNMLAPRSGEPIVAPNLDMVLGIYYLTGMEEAEDKENMPSYNTRESAIFAHEIEELTLREPIKIKINDEDHETTVGRLIWHEIIPEELGFRNQQFTKALIENLVSDCYDLLGKDVTTVVLDDIKDIGFKYATVSGTTIAIKDIVTPPQKQSLLSSADQKIRKLDEQYMEGMITQIERYQSSINVWEDVSKKMESAVSDSLPNYAGIYTMADSGAKGNLAQIKQMAGMRGLMSDPKGRIIELPIRSSFAEGLSVMEYFISTHGARKGLADTALRTADSGYLTRRLADVAQDLIINTVEDENAVGIKIEKEDNNMGSSLAERIVSRYPSLPVTHPETGEVLADTDTLISPALAREIEAAGIEEVWCLSPLSSTAKKGISQKCYGSSLATGDPALMGEAVGIIAAQSIGEPGTQLTMRTFHTGGIAGLDITSGLPRVIELFEARIPKGVSILSEISGIVNVGNVGELRVVRVSNIEKNSVTTKISDSHRAAVKTGQRIGVGEPITSLKKSLVAKLKKEDNFEEISKDIVAPYEGIVTVAKNEITITWEDENEREYAIPAASELLVSDGQKIESGEPITSGPKNPHEILRIQGVEEVQTYLVNEVQTVYRSQGVHIHDKHIEVILKQMLRKVRIENAGESGLLPGELLDKFDFEELNGKMLSENKEPAEAIPVLLGVTRASLVTDSFLAAASFQETARVLTEAAVNGSVDQLSGLKENVIIGRLIPARMDKSPEGLALLGIDKERDSNGVTGLTGMTQAPATFEEALAAIASDDDTGSNKGSGSSDDLLGLLSNENEDIAEKESSEELNLENVLNIEEDIDSEVNEETDSDEKSE